MRVGVPGRPGCGDDACQGLDAVGALRDPGLRKALDKDGKYGPANGYDINVSMALKAGVFVPPQSSLGVVGTFHCW